MSVQDAREWLRDRPALKARIVRTLAHWPWLDRRLRAVVPSPGGSGSRIRLESNVRFWHGIGVADRVDPLDAAIEVAPEEPIERILVARMAYVTALESALDDQAARHRTEVDSLRREIARLEGELARLQP